MMKKWVDGGKTGSMVENDGDVSRAADYVVDIFFFFKQKTAYEIYQCDWSSDVCSSDLLAPPILWVSISTPSFCCR